MTTKSSLFFPQLEHHPVPVEPGADGFREFQGFRVSSYELRNRMDAAGYHPEQGSRSDWVERYRKQFGDLAAVLNFSGMSVPIQDDEVVLGELAFFRGEQRQPLAEVPPVLLTECRYQLKALAESGPGFEPNWQKHF